MLNHLLQVDRNQDQNGNGNRLMKALNAIMGKPTETPKVLGLPEAFQLYSDINGQAETGGPAVPIAIINTARFFGVDVSLFDEASTKRGQLLQEIGDEENGLEAVRDQTEATIDQLKLQIRSAEDHLARTTERVKGNIRGKEEIIQIVENVENFFIAE